MNHKTRGIPKHAPALALAAPPAILIALVLSGQSVPAPAPAATLIPEQPAQPTAAPNAARAQQAIDWVQNWHAPASIASPMLYHAPAAAPAPAPAAVEAPSVLPQFVVKTVMGAGDRVMASINGKVYRVGDQPIPGWTIRAMDAKSKRVDLAGPDGQTISATPAAKPRS